MLTKIILDHLKEQRCEVKIVGTLVDIAYDQSNISFFFQELHVGVLVIAHVLYCILQDERINHNVLGRNEKAGDCSQLKIRLLLACNLGVVFVEQLDCLEHD